MTGTARLRGRLSWLALVGVLGAGAVGASAVSSDGTRPVSPPVLAAVTDDAGDARATTTHDGPMVRRRTAIALHPQKGADRAVLRRQLQAVAAQEKLGPLTDATFAVFSEDLLTYLVPEMTMVLPEGASPQDAEILMRDHTYPTLAFYLVESVLVHDLTFAVLPAAGLSPATVSDRVDSEGILADSLNSYRTDVQASGLTIRYFGALLSDGQILAVREAMARAAQVAPGRVFLEPTTTTGGVRLADEPAGAGQGHGHD